MEKSKNLGRAYLVEKLRERGLSRRQSVLVVNAIIEWMIARLRRGRFDVVLVWTSDRIARSVSG